MKYKAVLWDKDGTLLDTFAGWVALERSLAEVLGVRFLCDHGYPERVLLALGVGHDGRVDPRGAIASGTEEDILGVFYRELGDSAPSRELFRREARMQLDLLLGRAQESTPFEGIREVLDTARGAGLALGVATADTAANAERDLVSAGLDDYFGFVASSDSPGVKPDPWPVVAFAAWAGVLPAEVLMLGDAPVDRAMADNAGAGFVGVLWGTGCAADFDGARLVKHPSELVPFLEA